MAVGTDVLAEVIADCVVAKDTLTVEIEVDEVF
jgi:hypothetical protein